MRWSIISLIVYVTILIYFFVIYYVCTVYSFMIWIYTYNIHTFRHMFHALRCWQKPAVPIPRYPTKAPVPSYLKHLFWVSRIARFGLDPSKWFDGFFVDVYPLVPPCPCLFYWGFLVTECLAKLVGKGRCRSKYILALKLWQFENKYTNHGLMF